MIFQANKLKVYSSRIKIIDPLCRLNRPKNTLHNRLGKKLYIYSSIL